MKRAPSLPFRTSDSWMPDHVKWLEFPVIQSVTRPRGDRHDGEPLYEWIALRAREHALAGATVLRGIEGFGARSRLHTTKIPRLSEDLPIIVEIVDTQEKLDGFRPLVDAVIEERLATVERV